ncbi:patatin-like phospholipase family protein [Dyella caseinilytica]|uniref:Patatin-like phospholipase family protein n=1 Tax=Dyella caseinilytica TaxID=1849581 RepID=A0ABX7GZU2_9GAMM|nr:patatin-like phospholipase family protein [Dyella caseinilytica]QRN56048.1 patatin-like phospholipase family protein [Dyella caseinilytica]
MAVTDLRSEVATAQTPRKPTVALALGAGGAKGLAHIGAIEELQAQGFEITAIAGCSMGALIGGVYAMGKLDVYRDWVCSLDKFDVLKLVDWSFSFAGGGLIKGEKIIGTMLELIGDTSIEDLPIAFTAVATDIEREREVWLTRGSLFDAIRASIAIPTLFRPHVIDGRLLVDGALLNPVPVTPLIRDPADYLIAVSIDGPTDTNLPVVISAGDTPSKRGIGRLLSRLLPGGDGKSMDPRTQEHGALDLLGQSIDLMQANLSRLRLAAYQPDLLVQLARNVSSAYEFYRARELVELGRGKMREALSSWNPSGR